MPDTPPPITTQAKVAEALDLSLKTVSRALTTPEVVSERTRQRVQRVIEEMGYRPQAAARMMRARKTFQVGVLIRNAPDRPFHGPAQYETILGINERLEKAGYLLSLIRIGDVLEPEGMSRVFRERWLDGMIVTDALPDPVYSTVERLVSPCVWVESNVWRDERCLRRDEQHAANTVVDQLAGAGYQRLAYAVPRSLDHDRHGGDTQKKHYGAREHRQAIQAAVQKHGIQCDDFALPHWTQPMEPDVLKPYLKPDTAIITEGLAEVQRIRVFAAKWGLVAGRDYGIASCGESLETRIGSPEVCRVSFDRFALGRRAAEMMLQVLENPDSPCPSQLLAGQWIPGQTIRLAGS